MSDDPFRDFLILMAWQMVWIIPLSCVIVYFTAPMHCYAIYCKRYGIANPPPAPLHKGDA